MMSTETTFGLLAAAIFLYMAAEIFTEESVPWWILKVWGAVFVAATIGNMMVN